MINGKLVKFLFTLTLTGILTLSVAGNVLANPNGYFVNNTEFLVSDVAAYPSMIQFINDAMGGNPNNLGLDLNGKRANYGAYITSLKGAKADLDSFNAFATQNPLSTLDYGIYDPRNLGQPVTLTSASTINHTITLTLNYVIPVTIADFAVTASGVAVTPTAISTKGTIVTLTVPTVVDTSTDQTLVYSVSYKGENPVVANTLLLSAVPNNVKVGQSFNIILDNDYSDSGYCWTYTSDSDAIKLIQQTYGGITWGINESVWTFQATQTGSYTLHFSDERPFEGSASSIKAVDYIINVT